MPEAQSLENLTRFCAGVLFEAFPLVSAESIARAASEWAKSLDAAAERGVTASDARQMASLLKQELSLNDQDNEFPFLHFDSADTSVQLAPPVDYHSSGATDQPLLSPESEAIVKATAALVAEHAEAITAVLYPNMFASHPELLRVFNQGNQASGEQSKALAASVVAFAVSLIDPDAPSFEHVKRRIAHKHVSLGVTPEQYLIVGKFLIEGIAQVLGDTITPEIVAAWTEVYWLFSVGLVAEEARLYQQAGVDPRRPLRPYRIARRIDEADDVVSLVLEPADGGPLPAIEPGQYVSVFVDLPDGTRQPRQYTVSSTAFGTRLQITVSRVRGDGFAPAGRVSSYLNEDAKVGDILDLSSPAGDFVISNENTPLLLASAGAGIATVLPIVEHLARTQPERQVIIAHADRTAEDHALRETVLHVARHIDNFSSYTWYEKVDPDDQTAAEGYMDLSTLDLPEDIQVFTCGPLPFMRHVRSTLLARGVQPENIRYEVFGPDLWGPTLDRVAN